MDSIKVCGFVDAVIVNQRTGLINDGEHRWRAAQHLGMETVPVDFIDVDERTELLLLLRVNHESRKGVDDPTGLAELLGELEEFDGTLEGSGLSDDFVAGLRATVESTEDALNFDDGVKGKETTQKGEERMASFTLGEFRFKLSHQAYGAWLAELRSSGGYSGAECVATIAERLGIPAEAVQVGRAGGSDE